MTGTSGTAPTRTGFHARSYRVLVYALFVATTFTIAGSEASIILMMAVALGDPLVWGWARNGAPPAALPYGGQRLPWWTWGAFVALVGSALLSAALNPGFLAALNEMRFHYRVFLPLVLLMALPTVSLRRVFATFAVLVLLWGVYGLVQHRLGVDWFRPEGHKLIRPYAINSGVFHGQGMFTHHLTFGGVMLLATLFLLGLASAGDSGSARLRGFWAAGAFGGALGTVASLGRSAWLGCAAGLVVLGLLRLPRRWGLAFALLVLVVLGTYAALAVQGTWLQQVYLNPDTPPVVKRMLQTSPYNDVDRVRMWQAGLLAIQERPWFGAGMGDAATVMKPYREQISRETGHTFVLGPGVGLHDMYLQVLYDFGAVGLALYLFLWGGIFAWAAIALRALRPGGAVAHHPEAGLWRAVVRGAVAALAGSLVAGLFENNAYDKEVQQLLLILMGLVLYVGLRVKAAAKS
jgi:O-antigen ligase